MLLSVSAAFSFALLASPVLSLSLNKRDSKPGSLNVGCVVWNCGSQAAACGADTNCRAGLMAVNNCGTNQTCVDIAATQYSSEKFLGFTACGSDHNCVTPYPHTVYPTPSNSSIDPVDLSALVGDWSVSYGISVGADCYLNQSLIIEPIAGSDGFNHTNIFAGFSTGTTSTFATLKATSNQGVFTSVYTSGSDVWWILGSQLDASLATQWVLVYYQGGSKLLNYNGGYVLTMGSPLAQDDIDLISTDLINAQINVTFSELCKLY